MAKGKGKSRSRSIPLMGLLTAASLGGGIMLSPAPDYGGQSAATSIAKGDFIGAGLRAVSGLKTPAPYMAAAVPIVVWVLLKATGLSKKKLTRHVTLG